MPPCNSRRTLPPVPAQRTLSIHSIRSIHHSSNILFPHPLVQLLSRIIQRTRRQQQQQHQLLAMAIATVALAACCIHRSYRAVQAPATAITSAAAAAGAMAATITITAAATATQAAPMAMAAITATATMHSLHQLPRQQQQHKQPATWHSNCCARRPSYTQRARSAQHWPVWCNRRAVSGEGKG